MAGPAGLIEQAASRRDVRELVRLAWAFPAAAPAVDEALVQVLEGYEGRPPSDDLAALLTLPHKDPEWRSAAKAVHWLIDAGPDVASLARAAAAQAPYPASMRAAVVLEATGDVQGAFGLRTQFGAAGPVAWDRQGAPPRREPVGFGGWLVVMMLPLFFGPLSLVVSYLAYLASTSMGASWLPVLISPQLKTLPAPLVWVVLRHLCNVVAFTGGVGLAYLAIKKTRLFARLVIWYFPFETLANVPYYVALVMHGPLLARSITDVVGAAAIAVIWVLYYRRSRRVRNTFVN
jgi:hypothetical protein